MKKRMVMLTTILLCGAMLAGCGGGQGSKETGSASSSSAEAESAVSAEAGSEDAAGENATDTADAAGENVTDAAGENATGAADAAGENVTDAAGENVTGTADAAGENVTGAADAAGENVTGAADAAGENTTEEADGEDASEAEAETSDAASEMIKETLKDPILDIPTIEGEYTIEECVRLGEYKELKLNMEIDEVTEEDIDNYISYQVQPVEIDDESAELQEGDTANLDFTGYLDGEAFDGGAATGYDLEIGSGSFIPGFEEQMIGMKKGEERDLELTFPEDYGSEELAGQDVVFHVKLNAIKQMPEVDDAWAKEASNGESETLADFREATKAELEKQNHSYAETNLQNEAWNQVVENSEVLAFPEALLQEKRDEYTSYLESEAQIYGMTAAEYIEQMGMTQEDFEQINEVQVRTEVKNELLLDAVIEAEGVTEEDPAYQEELKRLEDNYKMTTDELKETYGEEVLDRHLKSIVAINKVLSYAEITETSASESAESAVSESTESTSSESTESTTSEE